MHSDDKTCNEPCCKRFIKINKTLHSLHLFHNLFTIIIWIIIIFLLVDYYNHIMPHSWHEGILWFEFVSYSSFLLVPICISLYKKYKINQCLKKNK